MKKKDWNEGLNHLGPDLVEEYVTQKEAYAQTKKSTKPYCGEFVKMVQYRPL